MKHMVQYLVIFISLCHDTDYKYMACVNSEHSYDL